MAAPRILLFSKLNRDDPRLSGVVKKIRAQAIAFRKLGYQVDTLFTYNGGVVVESSRSSRLMPFKGWYPTVGLKRQVMFLKTLATALPIAKYDVVYIRHHMATPLYNFMLKRWKRFHPKLQIVFEIPTYPYKDSSDAFSFKFKLVIDDLSRSSLKKIGSFLTTYSKHTELFGLPAVPLCNGVDVHKIKRINTAPEFKGKLHVLAVANLSPWHGYDRIIKGFKDDQHAANTVFHIVGYGSEHAKLIELAETNKVKEHIRFYGFTDGDALSKLFQKAHIAVGSLAMFRLSLDYGSPLKLREYCARGIPFIFAYDDPDFPESFPFAQQYLNDDSEITPTMLHSFYQSIKTVSSDIPLDMRAYAQKHLTWDAKLKPVDAYIRKRLAQL